MTQQADLRQWISDMRAAGEITDVLGAHWDLEIGGISEHNYRQKGYKALLFDEIPGYAKGSRLLTGSSGGPARLGHTFNLGEGHTDTSIVEAIRGKPGIWAAASAQFEPRVVGDGPLMECAMGKDEVDLSQFVTPRWHEHDGGRYLGTGSAVITVDPDSGRTNIGTYRMMVHDARTVTLQVVPGKHGRINYERWWQREGKCPVVISLGHDPLLFCLGGTEVPVSELNYYGAIRGEPLEVISGPATGLPMPASSEVVIEGFITPDSLAEEGPFGEWTGYYSFSERKVPVVQIENVFYRKNPIILGVPPGLPPHDFSYFRTVFKSAMIQDALIASGLPEVQGVWCHESGGGRMFTVVSIHQRYCGHARQAGMLASQLQSAAYMGRYVVVVDHDINPQNLDEVIWAMCTRSDPSEDIDFIRKSWGSPADPLCRDASQPYNSRAVIDACIPYDRRGEFPRVARMSPELEKDVAQKWAGLWS